MRYVLPAILVLAFFAACDQTELPDPDAAMAIAGLADEYVAEYFRAFPEEALFAGAPDSRPAALSDHSLQALAAWATAEDDMLERLRAIDVDAAEGPAAAVTYGFLKNQLEAARGFRLCRMELWNVSPTWTGWQARFALLASLQPTDTSRQREDALARFSEIPRYIDVEIDNLRQGVELGYTAPQGNVRSVIEQMDALLEAPVGESPFVKSAGDDVDFKRRVTELVERGIRPAVARYRDYLRDSYLATARDEVGVKANPNGLDCYRAALRFHTTIDLPPEEIHEIGLRQIELIMAEMREIGERSFGVSDPIELLKLVRTDRQYMFGGREELIAYAEAAVERARAALHDWFGRVPQARMIVQPYPAFQEQSAPGGQAVPPTADGKPGIYLINAYKAEEQSRAGLESTAFHESYPGHHLQGAIALERPDLHSILRYFWVSGFGEGWALYSERLADEMGLFSSDVDRLGLLSNEAARAARLVVDSGMHALGWSKQEAVDYFDAHTADTRDRAEAEIERYIAVPGQATSYMVGNLEIRRLREQAENTLGENFDIRAFHDLILEDGTLPLGMVRAKVERWLQ